MSSMNTDRTPEKRKPLKHGTPTGAWKERFRQGCLQRLKDKRRNMVNNARQTGAEQDESQSSQEFINEVILGEWDKMKLESPLLSNYPKCQYSEAFDTFSFGDDVEDINDILNVFEDIQSELLREEQKFLTQYEDAIEYDEQYLCAAIELLSTEYVLCPICTRGNLCQNKRTIYCACGLRIDMVNDRIDLKYIRNQLTEAADSHSVNCLAECEYAIVDLSGCGNQNLIMSCHGCDYMAVII